MAPTCPHPRHRRRRGVITPPRLNSYLPPADAFPFHAEVFVTPSDELFFCEIGCRTGGTAMRPMIAAATGAHLDRLSLLGQIDPSLCEEALASVAPPFVMSGRALVCPSGVEVVITPGVCPLPWVTEFRSFVSAGYRATGRHYSGDKIALGVVVGASDREVRQRLHEFTGWFLQSFTRPLDTSSPPVTPEVSRMSPATAVQSCPFSRSGDPVAETVLAFLDTNRLLGPRLYLVQGGYFEPPGEPDAFAVNTFAGAVHLARALESTPGARAKLGVLANDLGVGCGAVCTLGKHERASDELLADTITEIARRANLLPMSPLPPLLRERSLRNRGLRRMKHLIKTNALGERVRIVGDDAKRTYYLRTRDRQLITLFEEKGPSWIAKCPLIMAAFYAELGRALGDTGQPGELAPVIVDFSTYADKDRVTAGADVYRSLFADPAEAPPAEIVSVCCSRDGDMPVLFRQGLG